MRAAGPQPSICHLPVGVSLTHSCGLCSSHIHGLSAKLLAPPRGKHQPLPVGPVHMYPTGVLGKAMPKAVEKTEGRLDSGDCPCPDVC